eukprot:1101726-Prorocentrum_minimum.AAC.1
MISSRAQNTRIGRNTAVAHTHREHTADRAGTRLKDTHTDARASNDITICVICGHIKILY